MTLHVYELDGLEVHDLESFADLFSAVVLDGQVWSGNLDALNDILRGGFGTPTEGFILRVRNSRHLQEALGYTETSRWFEARASTCHPSNRDEMRRRARDARAGVGETLFDMLVGIIRSHGPGGDHQEDNVVLELDELREARRASAGAVVADRRRGERYRCPCCRYKTLDLRGGFEICPVCFWEDDGQDEHDAAVVRGGPNGTLSLEAARANFEEYGACERSSLPHVRAPRADEQ